MKKCCIFKVCWLRFTFFYRFEKQKWRQENWRSKENSLRIVTNQQIRKAKMRSKNRNRRSTKGEVTGRLCMSLGSLSNHDDDGNKNPTNLYIWQWKTVFLHALHVHFSFFAFWKAFSFFLLREMTSFAVVWTTWAYDDKCSILSYYVPSAGSNLIPG